MCLSPQDSNTTSTTFHSSATDWNEHSAEVLLTYLWIFTSYLLVLWIFAIPSIAIP